MKRVQQELIVGGTRGVHGRVATRLAEVAARYGVTLLIRRGDEVVDCSSILDVLALALSMGAEVCLTAEGDQAKDAMMAAVQLLITEDEVDHG
jgi:phosphocarrier protein HPr